MLDIRNIEVWTLGLGDNPYRVPGPGKLTNNQEALICRCWIVTTPAPKSLRSSTTMMISGFSLPALKNVKNSVSATLQPNYLSRKPRMICLVACTYVSSLSISLTLSHCCSIINIIIIANDTNPAHRLTETLNHSPNDTLCIEAARVIASLTSGSEPLLAALLHHRPRTDCSMPSPLPLHRTRVSMHILFEFLLSGFSSPSSFALSPPQPSSRL